MGRPLKQGIDYFPLDVDFFSNIKIRKIAKACGPNASAVIICLLCNIYHEEGYYILWDEDLPFVIADQVGVSEGCVKEVITKAVQVDFFSKELYDKYQILTSAGIQKRFLTITYKRKEVNIEEKYLVSDVKKGVSDVRNSVNDVHNQQSKEKVKKKEIHKESQPPQPEATPHPKERSVNVDFKKLQELFNETFKDKLPLVRDMTDARKRAVKARIAEHGKAAIMEVFRKIEASSFLLGHNANPNNKWKCNFDFIFSSSGFQKILEGNYDDDKSAAQVRNDRREEERQQAHNEQTKRNNERATYAINPFQLVKLREMGDNGNETAVKILSGEVRMTNIEITQFIKSAGG